MGAVWFALWAIIAVTIYLAVDPTSWLVALMAIVIASVVVVVIDLVLSKIKAYKHLRFRK